jgi:hypothetical protein
MNGPVDRDHDQWVAAIVEAIKTGTELDLAPDETVDAQQADNWPASRQLPGGALRAALLQPDIKPDPRGLRIRAACIIGDVDLAEFRIPYSLRFTDCAFEQPLRWTSLTISGVLGLAGCLTLSVDLDDAEIKSDAFLQGLRATGVVRGIGATIGGVLDLNDATLTNDGGHALILDTAVIKGGAFLRGLSATGEVRAPVASIGAGLHLEHATLTNHGGCALNLDNAEIKSHALLGNVTTSGGIRAVSASIGAELNLNHATLTKNGEYALNLDNAEIKNDALLGNLTATGGVRAVGANIGGQLNLRDATLTHDSGYALAMQSARLDLLWLSPASVKGPVILSAAKIDVLVAPEEMGVLTANKLDASGWRTGDIRGAIRHNRQAAAEWLTANGSGKDSEFVAQPWHELANVYDRNGQPADARWMRWKAARGVTRTSPPGPKLIRWIYGALTGHGYYPLVAAFWLILAVLVTVGIVATHSEDFAPTATNRAAWKPDVPPSQSAQPITGATPCDQLKDPSTCLNPVLWSFDNVLPGTLATGQAGLWTPNGAQGWNQWVPYTLGALKLFSWILVALLLAGVTGLLRKT